MCVDAAGHEETYVVGVWSDQARARVWQAPPVVWNQQAAELHAVDRAVRPAAQRGMKELNSGVDKLAEVWSILNKRTKIHHRDSNDGAMGRAVHGLNGEEFRIE